MKVFSEQRGITTRNTIRGGQMHPIAFRIGSIEIYWYGILMALTFLSAYLIAHYFGKWHGISADIMDRLFFSSALVGLVGARLGVVVTELDYYLAHPKEIFARGGMASHGAIAAIMLAAIITVRKYKLEYWRIADIASPILPVGHIFIRTGNFLNGELYGPPTNLPWAVKFPQTLVPVHPSQLYEVAASLVILPFAIRWTREPRYPGYAFFRVLLAHSIVRFFLDFIRQHSPLIGPFVLSQIIALGICIITIPAIIILDRKHSMK